MEGGLNGEGGLLEGGLNRGFTVFKTGNREWRVASGERRGGNRERQRHGERENEKMGTRQFKLGLARSVITLPILLLKTFCNKDCTASYYIALLCISNCFTLHCIVL